MRFHQRLYWGIWSCFYVHFCFWSKKNTRFLPLFCRFHFVLRNHIFVTTIILKILCLCDVYILQTSFYSIKNDIIYSLPFSHSVSTNQNRLVLEKVIINNYPTGATDVSLSYVPFFLRIGYYYNRQPILEKESLCTPKTYILYGCSEPYAAYFTFSR